MASWPSLLLLSDTQTCMRVAQLFTLAPRYRKHIGRVSLVRGIALPHYCVRRSVIHAFLIYLKHASRGAESTHGLKVVKPKLSW